MNARKPKHTIARRTNCITASNKTTQNETPYSENVPTFRGSIFDLLRTSQFKAEEEKKPYMCCFGLTSKFDNLCFFSRQKDQGSNER